MVKFRETESSLGEAVLRGRGNVLLVFVRQRSSREDENGPEMDGGGRTFVSMNVTKLKNDESGKFYVIYVLSRLKTVFLLQPTLLHNLAE